MELSTPVNELSRVGKTVAGRLKSLGILTVKDLLYFWPFRYDDFTQPTKIASAEAGDRANFVGTIEIISGKRTPGRRISVVEAIVSDETGSIKAVWFNQPYIATNLAVGDLVSLSGKVDEDFSGPFLSSPVYEKLTATGGIHTQGLVPNYHLTAGLTQKQLRYLVGQSLKNLPPIDDWLPDTVIKENNLMPMAEAIEQAHFPKDASALESARRRLAFDELLLIQLQARIIRRRTDSLQAAPIIFNEEATKKLVDNLPFVLTPSQKKAAWEILLDISKDKPMLRLLNGDVGSGKTVVALLPLYNAALNNRQAVLMAPTEILARQHYATITKLLQGTNVVIGLVTSAEKKINLSRNPSTSFGNAQGRSLRTGKQQTTCLRRQARNIISKSDKKLTGQQVIDQADIIIGTHALIIDKLDYRNLSLVVIDEQHRFGVRARQRLLDKAKSDGRGMIPHLLTMTATPIPRTLALALYDDLSLSVIGEMPAGRMPIITEIYGENDRSKVYEQLRAQINLGHQAFVICPLIDPSDNFGAKSAKEEYDRLKRDVFPDLPMGLMHGKLSAKAKESVMADFAANKTKILVATAVVEVGVDVPNATAMLIESSERFGLAQLHQYRGRIGRGGDQAFCWLIAEDLSENSKKRLNNLKKYQNGFDLAKADLEFRGPGEVYGIIQAGFPELKLASLFDYDLMKTAKAVAEKLINQDQSLEKWPAVRERITSLEDDSHLE